MKAWAFLAASRKWDSILKIAPNVNVITDHCPLHWLRRPKDPRHHFAGWPMGLKTIPFTITYRPGTSIRVPDYHSGVPHLEVDPDVNVEYVFEDRIYHAEDGWTNGDEAVWIERIVEEQLKEVIVSVRVQLSKIGRVQRGQLNNVSAHLNLRGEVINFYNRLDIPTTLRKEAI